MNTNTARLHHFARRQRLKQGG